MGTQELLNLLDELGLLSAPDFPVETLSTAKPGVISNAFTYIQGLDADQASGTYLQVSPLQMALAAASLSDAGQRLAPRLAMAVQNPHGGWVMLPVSGQAQQALPAGAAISIADLLAEQVLPIWQVVAVSHPAQTQTDNNAGTTGYTWYLGGTIPEWKGASLAIAVLLEEDNPSIAQEIGRLILQKTIYP
jgi:membrane peptidoglycan carboxypeptidase